MSNRYEKLLKARTKDHVGKIYKFTYFDYDVYYKLLKFVADGVCRGKVIRSNHMFFESGNTYGFDFSISSEIPEEDYNKIVVFE